MFQIELVVSSFDTQAVKEMRHGVPLPLKTEASRCDSRILLYVTKIAIRGTFWMIERNLKMRIGWQGRGGYYHRNESWSGVDRSGGCGAIGGNDVLGKSDHSNYKVDVRSLQLEASFNTPFVNGASFWVWIQLRLLWLPDSYIENNTVVPAYRRRETKTNWSPTSLYPTLESRLHNPTIINRTEPNQVQTSTHRIYLPKSKPISTRHCTFASGSHDIVSSSSSPLNSTNDAESCVPRKVGTIPSYDSTTTRSVLRIDERRV